VSLKKPQPLVLCHVNARVRRVEADETHGLSAHSFARLECSNSLKGKPVKIGPRGASTNHDHSKLELGPLAKLVRWAVRNRIVKV
jgi:hypothetical protein